MPPDASASNRAYRPMTSGSSSASAETASGTENESTRPPAIPTALPTSNDSARAGRHTCGPQLAPKTRVSWSASGGSGRARQLVQVRLEREEREEEVEHDVAARRLHAAHLLRLLDFLRHHGDEVD